MRFSPSISTLIDTTTTVATLATPLTSVPAHLGEAFVGEPVGQFVDPLLRLRREVLVTHPAADERELAELVDRVGELLRELARLLDGLRSEHEHEQRGHAQDGETDHGHGRAPPTGQAALQRVDERIEGEGDQHADADAGEHRRRQREHGEQGQGEQHRHDDGGERRAVEPPSLGDTTPANPQRRWRRDPARIDDGRGLTTGRGSPPTAVAAGYGLMTMSEPPERVRLVGFTVGTTLAVVVAVFAAYRLRNAFVAAHQVFGWVVACAVVALLLDPLVGLLQRVLPRWISVIVVLLGGLAVLGVVLTGLVRELGNSLDELERAAPTAARGLEDEYDWAARVGVADRVHSLLDQLDRSVREDPSAGPRHRAHVPGHGNLDAVPPRLRPPLRQRCDRAVRRPVTARPRCAMSSGKGRHEAGRTSS